MFYKKVPCNNCPYRKDAPIRHWAIEEFKDLLDSELTVLGTVYGCHKQDGHTCVGWLINLHPRMYGSRRNGGIITAPVTLLKNRSKKPKQIGRKKTPTCRVRLSA